MSEAGVAIVGAACRLPGADDVAAFWRNLRAGVDSIHRTSPAEVVAAGLDPGLVAHPDFVAARGVVSGADRFDHAAFGYSAGEAALMDPQHRVFLEEASTALDDAGIDPRRFDGWIGVFAGCDVTPPYLGLGDDDLASLGNEKDFLATRVAYKLGLRGPAMTVQTACSTSLVAIHLACQSLLGHECDAALAGGATLHVGAPPGYLHVDGHILSADGRCRAFDASATGTVSSDGTAVLVLRRLDDAIAGGNRILAVIRGSAVNNDGGEKIGYTAPSIAGQRDVIRLAVAQAGATAAEIGYVEAHGTGTRVGDPVEVAALTAAFREETDEIGACWLGAVKSNLGHTGAAAGAASLLKTALMLEAGALVPTLHVERPNPDLHLDTSPFRLCDRERPWPAGRPLAGVSSFGVGGTNVHLVLGPPPAGSDRAGEACVPRAVCLSAETPAALELLGERVAAALTADPPPRLDDAAWTLATGRRERRHRVAVVAADGADAAAAIRRHLTGPVLARPGGPRALLLFPGQGALHAGAGGAAHALLPRFRAEFDRIQGDVQRRFGIDLGTVLRPDADAGWLRDTCHQQLALFALGHALAAQLVDWGVVPVALLGHSVGECVAATLAGVWSLSDGLAIVHRRGRAMAGAAPGRMLAAALAADEVDALLAAEPGLTLAVDAPDRVVLAGDQASIDRARAHLADRGPRLLDIDHAFHHPSMRGAAEVLRAAVAAAPTGAPTIPILSNVTGRWATADQLRAADYWATHLVGPVRLRAAIDHLAADGGQADPDLAIELGPGGFLSGMLRRRGRGERPWTALSALGRAAAGERAALTETIAALWAHGAAIDWTPPFADTTPRCCSLPTQPFLGPALARPRAAPLASGPHRPPVAGELTCARWREIASARGEHPAVILVGERSKADAARLHDLGGDLGAPGAPIATIGWDADALTEALDRLPAPAIVAAALSDLPDAAAWERLDAMSAVAAHAGARVLVVVSAAPVTAEDAAASEGALRGALAWLEHRRQLGAAGAETTAILAIGRGDAPARAPALPLSGGAALLAWHARRWWARAQEAVRSDSTGDRGAPDDPLAIVAWGVHADGVATALAARGVRVAAYARMDDPPAEATDPLARELSLAMAAAGPDDGAVRLSRRPDLLAELDSFGAGLVAGALLDRGLIDPGRRHAAGELVARLDPAGRWPRWIQFLLGVLVEERYLELDRNGGAAVARDAAARARTARDDRTRLAELPGLCELLERCAAAYPDVMTGATDPVSVLYPDGDAGFLLGRLADNAVATDDAAPCIDALCRLVRARIAAHAAIRPGRPLRVLEIGAGSGSLTWRLLDGWPGAEASYHVTDVSPLVVDRVRARAAELGAPGVTFSTFDITAEPSRQGLAAGTYDLVIGLDVVHVAPSVRTALDHLRRLLRPDGLVGLIEVTHVPRWAHMVWGLAPGWWDHDDDLRDQSIHLDVATWSRALREAGFAEVAASPGESLADHALLLATTARPPGLAAARVAEEIRRQAAGEACRLVGVVGPETAAGDAVSPIVGWRDLVADPTLATAGSPIVLSVDPQAPGPAGRRAQEARRRLDPPDLAGPPSWCHLEVARLGEPELGALPEALSRRELPPVARLRAAATANAARMAALAAAPPRSDETAPIARADIAPAGDELRRTLSALWCDALQVPSVGSGDDFFELGGESLLAVHLVARVRERLGARIPVPAFVAASTFAGLERLVRAAVAPAGPARPGPRPEIAPSPRRDPDNLLVLRRDGARTPLILAGPAAGSTLCYRALAALLSDRPVHGVEAPGLHDDAVPLDRVEELAAHHVEVLKRARLTGPYIVGGWSVGALVAHEMARQLDRAGARVALVVCIDGYVPDSGGRPLATLPGHLAMGLWHHLRSRLPGGADARALRGLTPGDLPGATAVYRGALRAMLRYAPGPAPCPAVVFKTQLDARGRARLARRLGRLYPRGVTVRAAEGDHHGVLERPAVERLARDLDELLDELERDGRAAGAGR